MTAPGTDVAPALDERRRPAVCITGMHRCGTSFASRTLQLLGVSLGDDDALMGPGPDNPAGYFENRAIKEFDDELLAALGGAWDRPPRLRPGWEDAATLDPFRARAAALVAETFAGVDPEARIGFKDPRVSLLLPFWRTVLPIDTTVVMVRAPDEVIASLGRRRKAVVPAQAAMMWIRYLLAARANDAGHLLVRHDDFFDDLDLTIDRLTAHLGRATATPAEREAIRSHLNPDYHHGVQDHEQPDRSHPVIALATEIWDGGRIDLPLHPDPLHEGLAHGWLDLTPDDDALAAARAETISTREALRRRIRELDALKAAQEPSPELSPPSPGSGPDRTPTDG